MKKDGEASYMPVKVTSAGVNEELSESVTF